MTVTTKTKKADKQHIWLQLDEQTHTNLTKMAQDDNRSLSNYAETVLKQHVRTGRRTEKRHG